MARAPCDQVAWQHLAFSKVCIESTQQHRQYIQEGYGTDDDWQGVPHSLISQLLTS
jgi:hypothetical protein